MNIIITMKTLIAIFLIMGSALISRSQSRDAAKLRAEVDKEFAKFSNGDELRKHCDACWRIIAQQVAKRMGIETEGHSGSENILTDVERDVSKSSLDETEPSIAISRTNPQIMVAGANGLYSGGPYVPVYRTTDAGTTWHTSQLTSPSNIISPAGDAIVISDDSGNFYYSYLIFDGSLPLGEGISDLMVARSTSNGATWSLGSSVIGKQVTDSHFEDKETIVIDRDPKSPYHGRLYIVWNSFETDMGSTVSGAQHYFSYSDDHGKTWSVPNVYSYDYGYFAQMRVGAGGILYIAAIADDFSSYGLLVSTDGGATFTENYITDYYYTGLKGDLRSPMYIAFDVDPSRNNKLYAVYATYDYDNSVGALYTTSSTDDGSTWSTPIQIGSDTGLLTDHFFSAVSVDATTGAAYASLYSSEEDPINNINTRVVRCSLDAPSQLESFGAPLFNPLVDTYSGQAFIGDYIWSDAYDGYFATAWCQTHPGRTDGDIFAFTATPGSSGVHQVNAQSFSVGTPVPNPIIGDHVSFDISSNTFSEITVKVFDLNGHEVSQMVNNRIPSASGTIDLDVKNLHAGIYRAVFSNASSQLERSFIIVR
jgi:hypothetical protein